MERNIETGIIVDGQLEPLYPGQLGDAVDVRQVAGGHFIHLREVRAPLSESVEAAIVLTDAVKNYLSLLERHKRANSS